MNDDRRREEEHRRILQEVLASRDDLEKPRNNLFLYATAAIIITLMVLWLLPTSAFPVRAKLSAIPSIDELVPSTMTIPERPISNDIEAFVTHDDPELKLIAARIVTSACTRPDARCYADALFHFTKENIAYLNDPISEYYETPQETLLARAADCDGHAILLASLLRSVGILTRFSYSPGHVAIDAWLPTRGLLNKEYTYEWVHYDPTCKTCRPGERMPRLR